MGDVFSFNLYTECGYIVSLSVLAMLTGIIGCSGAQSKHRSIIYIYCMGLVGIMVLFFGVWLWSLQFETTLEPVLLRQGEEFCNVTVHRTIAQELKCSDDKLAYERRRWRLPCGSICQNRMDLVNKMGGCEFMERLCKEYTYVRVGRGGCRVWNDYGHVVTPHTWEGQTGMTFTQCQAACNSAITCNGLSYGFRTRVCSAVSEERPRIGEFEFKSVGPHVHDQGDRAIVGADEQSDAICFAKEAPALVRRANATGSFLGFLCAATVAFIAAASVCGCLNLYTESTGRKGKKSASALCYKLMCPCLKAQPSRKFATNFEEDAL